MNIFEKKIRKREEKREEGGGRGKKKRKYALEDNRASYDKRCASATGNELLIGEIYTYTYAWGFARAVHIP